MPTTASIFRSGISAIALIALSAAIVPCQAQEAAPGPADNASNLKLTGFLSVVGGEVSGGSYNGTLGGQNFQCPCYVSDWANAGVYTRDFSFTPDSHVGVQADYTFNKSFSFTGQLESRGTDPTPSVEYAFVDYKINGHWDIHAGRERLPLYYYSDFQDIGVAYPWISPPAEVYGWEATNYNGGSVRYKGEFDGIGANGELYTGFEYVHKDAYSELLTTVQSDIRWKDIIGATVEAEHEFWTVRANYMTANVTWDDLFGDNLATQRIRVFGVAANLDFDKWFIVSETGEFERDNYLYGYTEHSPSFSVGAGVRYGAWTPLLNYAKFIDFYKYEIPNAPQQEGFPNGGWGATLRYDIDPASDVKVQYDKFQDMSPGADFSGNAKVLRISYDRVF